MAITRFARWQDGHRPLVVAIVGIITVIAAYGLSRTTFNANLRDLFRSDSGLIEQLESVYEQFGSDDAECFVIVRAPDVFAEPGAGAVRALTTRLEGGPWRVRSLARPAPQSAPEFSLIPEPSADPDAAERVRRAVLASPLIAGRLVASDGGSALLAVSLSHEDPLASGSVDELLRRVHAYEPPEGVEVVVSGLPVIRRELLTSLAGNQVLFFVLGNVAGITVALVLFRSIVPVLICTGSAMLGAVWALGALGLVGEPINPVNGVITNLVLIIGFTDSVHLVFEARRGVADGLSPRQAATRAVARIGPACFLTSLTTAIGMASLGLANQDMLRRFGIAAASGTGLAFVAVICLVPLAVGTGLGRHLGRPRLDLVGRPPRVVTGVLDRLLRHARAVSIMGVLIVVAMALAATRATPNSQVSETIPSGGEAARGLDILDESFGGMHTTVVIVDWEEGLTISSPAVRDAIGEVERALRAEPMFGPILSPASIGATDGSPPAFNPLGAFTGDARPTLVRDDLRRALVRTSLPDVGSARHAAPLGRVRSALREIESRFAGVRLTLAGNPIAIGQTANDIIQNLLVSLGLAGVIILIVIGVSERSAMLGLLSVLPNAMPILGVLALLGVSGTPLDLTGVVSLCVCLGIAVDDTIHVLTWTRHERARGVDVPTAVRGAMLGVGSALITSTAILVGGFAATLVSAMPLVRTFGALAMVSLLIALAGDLIILPALLAWLWRPRGSRNPPR